VIAENYAVELGALRKDHRRILDRRELPLEEGNIDFSFEPCEWGLWIITTGSRRKRTDEAERYRRQARMVGDRPNRQSAVLEREREG
jgi:hypothetical protein